VQVARLSLSADPSPGLAAGICLSFDDDHLASWREHRRLFSDFGVKATFFVRGLDRFDDAELALLQGLVSDGHELGSHSYRHRSVTRHYGGDPARIDEYLEAEVLPAIEAMRPLGITPTSFAFPYGHHTPEYDEAVLRHFAHVRGIAYRRRYLAPHRLRTIFHRLGSGDRLQHAIGIDNIFANDSFMASSMRKAESQQLVLSLFGHRIAENADDYSVRPSKLRALLQLAESMKLRSYTASQLT
jgi:peptidoglycan/xylan/chitin deacetylase (PgdA/CDA1 family)